MKYGYRALMIALCALLLLPASALGHTGGERQTVRLAVETKDAKPGDSVRVDLLLTDCVSADSLECDINYDPAALQLDRVENGDVFPKEYTVTNIKEKGRIRLAAISGPGVEKEGTVISMLFTVRGSGGSAILVTGAAVTTVDAENDYEQLYAYILLQNGGVTVNGAMTGMPAATPWISETPPPAPATPEPVETPEPAPQTSEAPAATEAPTATAEPEASIALPERDGIGPIDSEDLPSVLLIIGIVFVLLLGALIALLIVNSASRRKRKRKNAARSAKGKSPAPKRHKAKRTRVENERSAEESEKS
jgi:hypothetical protein